MHYVRSLKLKELAVWGLDLNSPFITHIFRGFLFHLPLYAVAILSLLNVYNPWLAPPIFDDLTKSGQTI